MRITSLLNSLAVICIFSCREVIVPELGCGILPSPIGIVVLDGRGNSLVTAKSDQVTITVIDNGTTTNVLTAINKLTKSSTNTTATSKYNGLYIACYVRTYCLRPDHPIKTFE